MAEETPFSSLGSLGSDYGGINPPQLDEKSLSAFEGDHISTPDINFPDREATFLPVIPSAGSLDSKHQTVNHLVKRAPSNPASPKNMSAQDFSKALHAYQAATIQANQDKNDYARIYSYNAGPSGNAFYKRYQAYGQEKFDKIGFHPFRDNEAIFNASTSGWDDTKRMMSHAFWPLFKTGFKSVPKSLKNMLSGDFSADTEDADLYAEAAAIGSSTRGGISAMLNNTAMSFGYTAGIIGEALLEEAVAFGLTAGTEGGALPALFATTANNLRKIPKIFEGAKAIDKTVDGMRAMNTTLKSLDKINDARSYWNASKAGSMYERTLGSKAGRFFNPLENLSESIYQVYKNEDNLSGLARLYKGTQKTVGGLYGDVKAINMALSEARLEGGMQQNEVYDKLYNDYYSKNGFAPSDDEQKRMMETAKEAGVTSVQWNTGLIFASNKIVLDNLVSKRGGYKSWLGSKTDEIMNLETGSVKRTMEQTTLKSGRKFYKPKLAYEKNNLANTLKAFYKEPLSKSVTGATSYFKRNLTEALQENAQDVISEATKNYYLDSYSNPALATYRYAEGLTKGAIKAQFSGQGAETFASGMLMGMFASPLNLIPKAMSIGYNKIFDKENYQKYADARANFGNRLVNELSSVDMAEFWNNRMFTYGAQNSTAETINNGTEKEAKDASDASFIHSMITAADNNMMDHYVDYLSNMSELSAEELEEAIPSIPPGEGAKYLEKLPQAIQRAKKIEQRHNFYKENFPNPVNLDQWKDAKDHPDYEDAMALHSAWNVATRNAILLNESFENTMSRMSSIVNDVSTQSPLANANYNDINLLFDNKKLLNEKRMLDTELKSLRQADQSNLTPGEIKNKERKLEALTEYSDVLEDYTKVFRTRKAVVDKLKADDPEISEDEINAALDEMQGSIENELRDKYKNYLKALASESNDYIFDSKVDESFNKLIDFHKLDAESRSMVEYINLLHDPKGFKEHVDRNKVWMKQLYDNRREYYESLKEQEFIKKENNDLLNSLANQGIYISLEDFENWQDSQIFPEEFYDDVNKVVIRETHPRYEELIQPFRLLAEIQNKTATVESKNEALKQELERLNNEQREALEALPTEETRTDLGEIGETPITFKKVLAGLEEGNYVDLIYTQDDVEQTVTLYKDGEGVKFNDAEGDLVDITNPKLSIGANKFDSAKRYTITQEADPDAVSNINEKYEKLKAEAVRDNVESGAEMPVDEEVKDISTDTAAEALPIDLHNKLMQSFLENGGDEYDNEDDFNMAFDSFIRTNFNAANIIDEYNKEKKLAQATKVQPGEEPTPSIIIQGKKISMDELSMAELKSHLKSLEIGLKNLQDKEEKTPEDENQIIYYQAYIKVINDYLSKRNVEGLSERQQATMSRLKSLMDAQRNIKRTRKGYEVDGVVMERVTNAINKFKEAYVHINADEIKVSYATTIGRDGLSPESIDAFMDKLREYKNLNGFSEFTYKEVSAELNEIYKASQDKTSVDLQREMLTNLEEDLKVEEGEFGNPETAKEIRKQITDIESSINRKLSNEDLLNTTLNLIGEKTNEASRIAGNYLDDQIRRVFDNKPTTFDSKSIDQKAFDNLFSTDPSNPGYIVSIKKMIDDNGIHIISRGYGDNGVILYDTEAGVAGEVDLLGIDRDGRVMIIDTKTGKKNKWENFNNPNAIYGQKPGYTLQQLAYSNLLFNQTGLKSSINILPVEVEYDKETGEITKANRPTAKNLTEPGDFKIKLTPTAEQIDQINSLIPLKGKAATPDDVVRENADEEVSPAVKDQQTGGKPVVEDELVDPKVAAFIKTATFPQLNNIKAKLAENIDKYPTKAVTALEALIEQREKELSESAVNQLSADNLSVNTRLIAKEIIFTDKNNTKQFASQGSEVRVVSVVDATQKIVLKTIGNSPKQKTISFDELDKLFKLKETVMDLDESQAKPEASLTKDEQEKIVTSSDNVKNLLGSDVRKQQLKDETKNVDLAVIDNDLFEDKTSDC
jgi:hypothetical protein